MGRLWPAVWLSGLIFDFADSGITGLQRLDRRSGRVLPLSLTHVAGSVWRHDLELHGGTGDLLKFDTGARFIDGPAPGAADEPVVPRREEG